MTNKADTALLNSITRCIEDAATEYERACAAYPNVLTGMHREDLWPRLAGLCRCCPDNPHAQRIIAAAHRVVPTLDARAPT